MAFDFTITDREKLYSEIENDPEAVGYPEFIPDNFGAILVLINDPASNPNADLQLKPVDEVTVVEVAGAINPTEYAALSEYDKEFIKSVINRPMDEVISPYKGKFIQVFPNGTTTFANLQTLREHTASRAEVLFGYGSVIYTEYLQSAFNYQV